MPSPRLASELLAHPSRRARILCGLNSGHSNASENFTMVYRVYVTSNEVPEEALDMVRKVAEVKINENYGSPSKETLLREVVDIDGLFCNITEKVDAQLLEAGKKLKIVASMSVGFDHIDLEAAPKRGMLDK